MGNVTATITGIDQDQGRVRVEMTTEEGHALHEDVKADLSDEAAVRSAIDAVALKFATDVAGKVPTNLPNPPLAIEKLIGQVREIAVDPPDMPAEPE